MSDENCEFLIQHTIRADRVNDGFTQAQVVVNLQSLEPDLSHTQAKSFVQHTLKKRSAGRLKPRPVKAQKTTSKRSQCTVAQQYRWFKNYEKAISFLREKNTGICNKTGKQFGELIEHFILGGDETCLIADADGDLKIVGEYGKKKHEKKAADYKGSITMYRTGNAAGNNGPTAFVMKGKKRRAGYSDAFLRQEGCAEGSTIVMTENAFMTDAAWETMADSIVRGYRGMPIVRDNPQWWMVEIFDGFGAHLNNLPALKKRVIAKILSLKEEGDSSSFNQAYDREVAKSDKNVQRMNLSYLRQDCRFNRNIIDQWKLLCCGLAAVRHTAKHPEIWDGSFRAVNLHPKHQISFEAWCKKLEPFMKAADSFNLIAQSNNNFDVYTLLPGIWQAMSPLEKQSAVDIVQRYDKNAWSVECCHNLMRALQVSLADLPSLQPCIFLAIEHPSHIQRGVVAEETLVDDRVEDEVAAVECQRETATAGLSMFERRPEGLHGLASFNHQVNFRQRAYATKESEHKISAHLDTAPPCTHHQGALMSINYAKKVQGTMMADLNAGVSLQAAAQVRLDNLGQIRARSQFINSPGRVERMEQRYTLQRSIGRAEQIAALEAAADLGLEKDERLPDVEAAINMLKAGEMEKRKFQIKHARAVLAVVFSCSLKKSASKKLLLETLVEQMRLHPEKIPNYLVSIDTTTVEVAAMPTTPTGNNKDVGENVTEKLFRSCVEEVKSGAYLISALELALLVLKVVSDIADGEDYDFDAPREKSDISYITHFFTAFTRDVVKRRSNDFIFLIDDLVYDMIRDEDLSEANLRKVFKENLDSVK